MEIIKSTLDIGIKKPFTFLHVSDIHLSETDENDTPARREFAVARKRGFPFSLSAIKFITDYVKKTGYPLINTGDMLDFVTPQNLSIAQKFVQDTNMMLAPGNHEYWTCPNNRFHYDDVQQTHAQRENTLDAVEKALGINVRFSRREINGVNMVCIDDSNYNITQDVFEKLKAIEAEGKPIFLFMHIPINSEHIEINHEFPLNAPKQYFKDCHPLVAQERTSNELTCSICDYICNSPLIKCVFSGHMHYSKEIIGLDKQNQIITGVNTIREITVI